LDLDSSIQNIYHCNNGKFNINGTDFVVHSTHYGDGIYKDTKNREYIVNGGVIGLVNIELIEDINLCNKNGYIYNFEYPVNFIYDAGLYIIKSKKKYIQIDTRNLEEYDSDKEDSFFNEDGEHIVKTIYNDSDNDSIYDENENYFDDSDDLLNTYNDIPKKIGIKFFK
jgi:hypothetical protein